MALWHINHCRLFDAKSNLCIYIYIRYMWFVNIVTLTLRPINFGVLTSLLLLDLSSSLTDSLISLNLLCHSKTDARFMQDAPKAAFFPSLKQNFIAYHSSKVSDSIFEIHQLWQSGFSRVYSNSYSSCSFEPEIIKIGQSITYWIFKSLWQFYMPVQKRSGKLLNVPHNNKNLTSVICLHTFK